DKPQSKAASTQVSDSGSSSAGETKAAAPQPATETAGGFSLDDFVGKWEFVGEPGPWGEGMPFTLKRADNLMVGEVEIDPMYDDQIGLKLAAGNDELIGESTTTWKDGRSEVHSIAMSLNEAKSIITLKFRAEDGEWIVRVAQKKSGGPR
ncbi:MAG: hypothetical protein WCP21_17890, partial [Armatimonadota bacterium]